MKNYRFVISIFGKKHTGMLLTGIYAIKKNIPGSQISVFWQDIPDETKKVFKKAFSEVDFYETDFDLSSDEIKRISSKILMWNYAATILKDRRLCFVDVDTLVIKDIQNFFDKNFDILYTYKKGFYPLNSGVMLCQGNQYENFFELWLKKTLIILNDANLIAQATSLKLPYGGADQMSLHQVINYIRGRNEYRIAIGDKELIFRGAPCETLNETNPTEIKEDTHIIHYKGGWQRILLLGKGFTKFRPKKKSWPMYHLYLRTHKEALEYLNRFCGKKQALGAFGIKIPFYISKYDLKENKLKYVFFSFISWPNKLRSNLAFWSKYLISKHNFLRFKHGGK